MERLTAGSADRHLEAAEADGACERDHGDVRGNQTVADERNVCRSGGGRGERGIKDALLASPQPARARLPEWTRSRVRDRHAVPDSPAGISAFLALARFWSSAYGSFSPNILFPRYHLLAISSLWAPNRPLQTLVAAHHPSLPHLPVALPGSSQYNGATINNVN